MKNFNTMIDLLRMYTKVTTLPAGGYSFQFRPVSLLRQVVLYPSVTGVDVSYIKPLSSTTEKFHVADGAPMQMLRTVMQELAGRLLRQEPVPCALTDFLHATGWNYRPSVLMNANALLMSMKIAWPSSILIPAAKHIEIRAVSRDHLAVVCADKNESYTVDIVLDCEDKSVEVSCCGTSLGMPLNMVCEGRATAGTQRNIRDLVVACLYMVGCTTLQVNYNLDHGSLVIPDGDADELHIKYLQKVAKHLRKRVPRCHMEYDFASHCLTVDGVYKRFLDIPADVKPKKFARELGAHITSFMKGASK